MLQSRTYRIIEFLVIMFGVPTVLYFHLPKGFLLPIIWMIAIYCSFAIRAVTPKSARIGWNPSAVTSAVLKPILIRFAASALLMALLVWQFQSELLFELVRTKPTLWMLVMLLYPILSVAPQEIIFREFFFVRYATFFSDRTMLMMASAVAFAFAHIFFHNWVAPLLCLIGGGMFASTYARHRSLLLVSIEHALYGCFIFTLGLGRYFYHGAIH